jgi:hypothetical protein
MKPPTVGARSAVELIGNKANRKALRSAQITSRSIGEADV